jgi:hypothetical protein
MIGRRIPHLVAALALATTLHLAASPPAAAGGLGPAAVHQEKEWVESVWSWLDGVWERLARLVPSGGPTARWEPGTAPGAQGDSGGIIDPNGGPSTQGDSGGMIDPNG